MLSTLLQLCIVMVMQIKLTVVVVALQAHFLTFFFCFISFVRTHTICVIFLTPLSPAGHPFIEVVTILKLLGTARRFSGSKINTYMRVDNLGSLHGP